MAVCIALRSSFVLGVGAVALVGGSNYASCQTAEAPFKGIVPEVRLIDDKGVDLLSDRATVAIPLVSFAPNATEMSLSISLGSPNRFDWDWSAVSSNTSAAPIIGAVLINSLNINWNISYLYSGGQPVKIVGLPQGGGYYDGHTNPSVNSDGSTIRQNYGASYATEMTFPDSSKNGAFNRWGLRGKNPALAVPPGGQYVSMAYEFFRDIDLPNGETWTIYAEKRGSLGEYRPRFMVSNKGFGIQITYQSSISSSSVWYVISSIKSYNKSKYYCDESALINCAEVSSLQDDVNFTYNNSDGSVVIAYPKSGQSRKLTFEKNSSGATTIRLKSDEKVGILGSKVSYGYSPLMIQAEEGTAQEPTIGSITTSDGVWTYTYDRDSGGFLDARALTIRTAPDGTQRSTYGAYMLGLGELTDELGRTVSNCIGGSVDNYRSSCANMADGRVINYAIDARGNITAVEFKSAPGTSFPDIRLYATYPSECLNPKTCNRPLTVADANGGVTTYTYAAEHGGVLTMVPPADPQGRRNSKKYYYAQRYALTKNAGGQFVQAPTPIWLLVEERTCKASNLDVSSGSCSAGASDLIRTTYDYGPTSGAANNLLLRSTVIESEGSALRSCYGYDEAGNRVSETKPNANLAVCP